MRIKFAWKFLVCVAEIYLLRAILLRVDMLEFLLDAEISATLANESCITLSIASSVSMSSSFSMHSSCRTLDYVANSGVFMFWSIACTWNVESNADRSPNWYHPTLIMSGLLTCAYALNNQPHSKGLRVDIFMSIFTSFAAFSSSCLSMSSEV